MKKIVICILLCLSCTVLAEEKGSIGFSAKVGVDGFFNPEITSFEIEEVHVDSPAEKAGLNAGDQVIAIGDCVIPGCDTDDAQDYMDKKAGEELKLKVITQDGQEKEVVIIVGPAVKEA
ncbi:MAG: PDZ domain-containing protein [Kangiella sp.]|nr:PDZ domain-containing protein [Kangiella sp.]